MPVDPIASFETVAIASRKRRTARGRSPSMLTLGQKMILVVVIGILDLIALLLGGVLGLLVVVPSIAALIAAFRL
ncbi:hypothetical protein [Halococcoides cellulosivorans]|uniref:hypothetical protein n=1 Tax=Halococcoides cellulosivorans TaxID=1679096 RepID=UPI00131EE201|nr:hypothetical protein [Halococcoides cellulosivorans]